MLAKCERSFVHGDVEASLAEFLFDVDLARVLNGEQVHAHPGEFATSKTGLGDVDGGAGEVGTDDVAFGISGVVR